ncbi:MAG: hypothetical protein V4611_03820 [Patescibacteria group bacterium]
MFILFSHAGHVHAEETLGEATQLDLSPYLLGAAVLIFFLFAVIVYLTVKWEPKKSKKVTSTVDEKVSEK